VSLGSASWAVPPEGVVWLRAFFGARGAHRDGHERRAANQKLRETKNTNTPVRECLRHREEGICLVGNRAWDIRAVVHVCSGLWDHTSTGCREQLNRNASRRGYLDENWSFQDHPEPSVMVLT
jgi:hypothetical protein